MNQEEKMNVQYDVYAKELLSQKEVLARILKFTIAEFQDMGSEEIMEMIEGDPLVSEVSVKSGETNRNFHGKIRLLSERKDMPVGTHFRKELDTMCNLSLGIEERGIKKGIEQGMKRGARLERLGIIKNMLLQHMSTEDIMKYSGATEEEIGQVKEQLCVHS